MNFFKIFYSQKITWFFEHLLFMVIPMMVMVVEPFNQTLLYGMFLGTLIYMAVVGKIFGVTLERFGLTSKYFLQALKLLSIPTLLICVLLLALKPIFPQLFVVNDHDFLRYVFILVPLQEVVFRGICLWRCSLSWKNQTFINIFNSGLFALYHLMFGNLYLAVGVFLLNLFWNRVYYKYPNLFALMLSHAVIGLAYFS